MKFERTNSGQIEIRLSYDPGQFRRIAEKVRTKLGGEWLARIDGLDQSYWDLNVAGQKITVHREHYLGVSVFSADDPSKRLLLERLLVEFDTKNNCEMEYQAADDGD